MEIFLAAVRGPGHVSGWFSHPEGPQLYFSTADGISLMEPFAAQDALDEYPQFAGGHSHINRAFTAPGDYEVDLRARIVLAGGAVSFSDPAAFYFEVRDIPEPSASVLLLSGLCARLSRRRRTPV